MRVPRTVAAQQETYFVTEKKKVWSEISKWWLVQAGQRKTHFLFLALVTLAPFRFGLVS